MKNKEIAQQADQTLTGLIEWLRRYLPKNLIQYLLKAAGLQGN